MKKSLHINQSTRQTMRSKLSACGLVASTAMYSATSAAASQSLGDVANNITSTFGSLANLITGGAYIGGLAFALSAILKFKQHKDNPTQVTIGAPIALLFIAAALIFLPTIFGIAGQTVFGSNAISGGITGTSTF